MTALYSHSRYVISITCIIYYKYFMKTGQVSEGRKGGTSATYLSIHLAGDCIGDQYIITFTFYLCIKAHYITCILIFMYVLYESYF